MSNSKPKPSGSRTNRRQGTKSAMHKKAQSSTRAARLGTIKMLMRAGKSKAKLGVDA